ANCISDWLCRTHEPEGPGYDAGGERAMRGRACDAVVKALAGHSYTRQSPPKSTDGPAMIAAFEQALAVATGCPEKLEDLLATACAATAATVEASLDLFVPGW